ncbi:hypothetical protein IFT69_10115 [Pseudomonas putida]|nr:hypothetical protein [Pseudomonas putida]
MNIYRAVWALFMVLVVTPAFILASGTELQTLHETALQALRLLHYYNVPHFLAIILGYPIAVVATILPGSSSLIPFLGNMIWEQVGVIFLAVALLNVSPPFYKKSDREV